MEQLRMYKLSLYPIFALMFTGGIMFFSFCFMGLKDILSNIFYSIVGLFFSLLFLGYSIYLLRKRRQGKGIYWDNEGIVIDLRGNKVYWEEIESIQYSNVRGMRSTVIYPHYTYHEKVRIRRKKWMPTPAHSIDWFYIEKPKEFHRDLMKTWEEKRH
ncbi:hypothetical protein [Neobacillus citreus]|uniref:Uncharacterized protein n=1 Tax=Neobacillus citreus TaxID=2833578 RepID=A0A942YA79_9BACI|nr:hypothetical protein [Neobacillus citreus]MCH6266580.1 hypothetical protein [Neobacillus citreus]